MSKFILCLLAVVSVGLVSCATAPSKPVPPSVQRTLAIKGVDVRFEPDFRLPSMGVKMFYYGEYRKRYPQLAQNASADGSGRGRLTKEYIALTLGNEVGRRFTSELRGHRPTKIVLTVSGISLSGPTATILIGRNNAVKATAEFVDLKTGALIGRYEDIYAQEGDQGGLISAAVEAASKYGPADDAAHAFSNVLWNRFYRS